MIVRKQSGLTIFEMIIVLVISAAILFWGIRQYQLYRSDADVQQLKYNVDLIFQAMSAFYNANCFGTANADQTIAPAVLNFDHDPAPTDPYIISLEDLISQGYLTSVLPNNPLVDNTDELGYILQFNLYTAPKTTCLDTDCTNIQTLGTIVIWKPQIAIKLRNPALVAQYQNLLLADCVSDFSDDMVTPCKDSSGEGTYLVWERMPAFASPNTTTNYLQTLPANSQFKNMYTTNPVTNLTGRAHTTEFQYFYCGG